MKLKTLNTSNEVIETITNDEYVLDTLIKQLWNKTILKNKDIKRIHYQYNYTDKQTIKITFTNGLKYVFEDIPTTHGCIDIDKIERGGKDD